MKYDLIVIGGGAAGFFAALTAKAKNPKASIAVLEKTALLLSKVRISGGGRCNVTHSCFEPKALCLNYPRGSKELVGPFHRFQPKDTIEWFESRGVLLKTEEDGRMFPITNRSQTIIDCLLSEAKQLGVEILLKQRVETIVKEENGFKILSKEGHLYQCSSLILASGSSTEGHEWAESFGHTIIPPVPSLFTFNVPTSPLKELSGLSWNPVELKISGTSHIHEGPLLITHFGFSGPAALKLSAWGARTLFEREYRVDLIINWLPHLSQEDIFDKLFHLKKAFPYKILLAENIFGFPKNLWKAFACEKRLNDLSSKELHQLAEKLHADLYQVDGKTTHKEEFVTCGGVSLSEVDFKTMQSKVCPGLFFAGEILDIDGITGGFNFQNAWTTGYTAGSSCF